jgi:hypothetical protein
MVFEVRGGEGVAIAEVRRSGGTLHVRTPPVGALRRLRRAGGG